MTLYAHSPDNDRMDWEPLTDHLSKVAAAAGKHADAFGGQSIAECAGWLHDLGKVKPGFQAKLRGQKNSEPHSGEGARYAHEKYGPRAN